ncbi:MAG: amidohydrolase [Pseudomonadota bacterium]
MHIILALSLIAGCDVTVIEGRIETPTRTFEAVAIDGTQIDAVGTRRDMPIVPDDCRITLDDDQIAFPGLTDAHIHLLGVGLREMNLNLDSVGSIGELKMAVAAAAEADKSGGPVIGRGWIETAWPQGRPPMRDDLDAVVDDRPVLLMRADGHAMAVNTAALRAANITPSTDDPEGGRIVRDENGQANGILIDNAMVLVEGLIPTLDEDRRREGLRRGAQRYASLGWTGVHNMSVDAKDMPLLEELAINGDLPLRVANFVVPSALDGLAEQGPHCDTTGFVCHLGVKFYADGALGSRGALLKAPYTDEPTTRGLALISREEAMPAFSKAAAAGLQVTTHAIGDEANYRVLAWYKDLRADYPNAVFRIEHAQILDPSDIERFAEAGVIASMQPSHAIGDLHFAPDRLGMERLRGAYAWNSLATEGTLLVFGSDAPVEQGDPRIELYAAHVRRDLEGFQGEGWHPEEALSRSESLALFTVSPALSIGRGGEFGTLAPGFAADLSIFRGDPFEGPSKSEAVATIIDGQIVSGEL